jgi:hypothetical protein
MGVDGETRGNPGKKLFKLRFISTDRSNGSYVCDLHKIECIHLCIGLQAIYPTTLIAILEGPNRNSCVKMPAENHQIAGPFLLRSTHCRVLLQQTKTDNK